MQNPAMWESVKTYAGRRKQKASAGGCYYFEPAMKQNSLAVLLPYYNEAGFIGATLRSLLRQERRPDQIILVDNASTDGSEAVCRAVAQEENFTDILFLREERPGKVNALETGCRHLTCEFTALCDADLWYPPHYCALALQLFEAGGAEVAGVMGQYVEAIPSEDAPTRRKLQETVRAAQRFTSKCFAGGGAQFFRTSALLAAGGFSAALWKYVLLDHEIVNRVRRHGRFVYHPDLWCLHTARRGDRGRVRWNLTERMLYRYTPGWMGDWFFYRFLGPRLEKKRMSSLNLRDQPWKKP
jgi:glycosyltransferase involved in cell wall biosynthesis